MRKIKLIYGSRQVSTKLQVSDDETEVFLDALDENLMKKNFELVHQDYLDGNYVSNSQVVDYIKGELRWK